MEFKKVNYVMNDGTPVELSITMKELYRLKTENKDAYDRLCKGLLKSGITDVLEIAEFIYGAYVCSVPGCQMPYEEFIEKMNQDVETNAGTMLALKGVSSKK